MMSDEFELSLRLQGLPPVIDGSSRILMLGSMPGMQSLVKQEYYGNPRNHFWRLLYAVWGEGVSDKGAGQAGGEAAQLPQGAPSVEETGTSRPLAGAGSAYPVPSANYKERLRFALEHGVGLWDVLAACEREGSLDADIRKPEANDFAALLRSFPTVERIWFNGQAAAQLFRRQVLPALAAQGLDRSVQLGVLPSSSPARTLSFEAKLEAWRQIRS